MRPRCLATITLTLLAGAAAASCGSGGTTTAGATQTMHVVAGNGQTASLSSDLAVPPTVSISDQDGKGLANISVTFTIASGGGHFTAAGGNTTTVTIVTDADGVATAPPWTLGNSAGANSATATAPGVTGSPVTFTATAVNNAPPQIFIYSGNNLSGPAGVALDVVQFVEVVDGGGLPIQGASVTYQVTSGGGSLEDDPTHLTGPTGLTFVRGWVLGTTPGVNTMTATITGTTTSVTFTATGR